MQLQSLSKVGHVVGLSVGLSPICTSLMQVVYAGLSKLANNYRPFRQSMARISSIMTGHPLYQLMPSRNTLTNLFPNCSFQLLSDILDRNLRLLDGVSTNTNPGTVNNGVSSSSSLRTLLVEAEGNTWSRSARRSRCRVDSSTI